MHTASQSINLGLFENSSGVTHQQQNKRRWSCQHHVLETQDISVQLTVEPEPALRFIDVKGDHREPDHYIGAKVPWCVRI